MAFIHCKFKSVKFAECAEKTSYVNKQISVQASEKSK